MSLSDYERLEGIYFCINGMVQLEKPKVSGYDKVGKDVLQKLEKTIDQLWHSVLGQETNSIHWLFGSETHSRIHKLGTCWTVAICNKLGPIADTIQSAEENLEENPEENPEENSEDFEEKFNGVDYCNIPYMLKYKGHFLQAYIFQIYEHAQHIRYFLRRYNDPFLAKYPLLNKLLSDIFGCCFAHMSENELYAKAYLTHQILGMLYGNKYPYDTNPDTITSLMVECNFHHDFPALLDRPLNELVDIHIKLEKDRLRHNGSNSIEARAIALVKTCKLYEYTHVREKVEQKLKDSELWNLVEPIVLEYQEKFDKNKKEKQERDTIDNLRTTLNCYGSVGQIIADDILFKNNQ